MRTTRTQSFARKAAAYLLLILTGTAADLSGAFGAPAEFAVGPQNNQALLLKAFRSARRTLQINAYDFGHAGIAEELIESIRRGVTVELLVETQPFKGSSRALSPAGKKVLIDVFAAMKTSANPSHRILLMGSNLYWENGSPVQVRRRFVFNHAKYVIVDRRSVLVSSENMTETGHPDPGKKGNRGWDILLQDAATVREFQDLFRADSETTSKDVLEVRISGRLPSFVTRPLEVQDNLPPANPAQEIPSDTEIMAESNPAQGEVSDIQVITSPQAMPGLNQFMESARKSLDLQFMSLPSQWFSGPNPYISPLIEQLLENARSGIEVRVLLNDDRVFQDPGSDGDTKNAITTDYLNLLGRCHGLPIAAKIVDVKAVGITYIHNKGMIVDDRKVLISSINGTRNSVQNNRETAVAIESPAAGKYFGAVFSNDWSKSSFTRLTSQAERCPTLPSRRQQGIALATPWSRSF